MSLKVANRVKESTLTSGNGTIALAGAMNGYQSFSSVLSNGDTTYYTIVNADNWEVGIGTYSSGTLSRDSILSSSNSNNKLSLSGQSFIFIAYPSEKSVYKDANGQVVAGSSGIIIESGNPFNTANVLYNSSGLLYFNGLPVNNDPEVVEKANSLVTTVFNRTSSPIPKFSVVYISGGQGDLPIISLALANGEPKSSKTFGVTEEIIPAMSSGRVVSYGNIIQVNTDAYNVNAPHGDINGQVLYLSPTVSGGLTITKPYAPNHLVAVGTVIRTHQNEGVFNVRIQNGFELEELHNVAATGATSGQFIKYNGSLWRNSTLTSADISDFSSAVSGISPNISISGTSGIAVDKNGNSYTVYATGTFGLTSSQIQQLLNSGVSINVVSGTGNFNSLSVTNIPVSLSGHTHTSSQITDFNASVNSLISVKNVSGSGYVNVLATTGNYIVSVSGLQPIGNYSLVGHSHLVSDITNFSSGVSGLLPFTGIIGSGYVNVNTINRVATISVSGLQPSGNYSVSGHTHTVSNITDFNSSVSGLLPVTNIIGTSGASVTSSGTVFTVAVTGSFGLTTSEIQTLLNSGVSINAVSGTGNFNSLSVTGIPVSVSGHSHTTSDISNFGSEVSGLLSVKDILPGTNVSISSISGIYTISSSGTSGGSSVSIYNPGSGRILSSDGTSSGIIAETTLTFANNALFINGVNVNNGKNLYLWATYR